MQDLLQEKSQKVWLLPQKSLFLSSNSATEVVKIDYYRS